MQVGKFKVVPHSEGTHEGGFSGYLLVTWDEGDSTYEEKRPVDGVFPTQGEAIEHATVYANGLGEADLP